MYYEYYHDLITMKCCELPILSLHGTVVVVSLIVSTSQKRRTSELTF